MKVPYNNETESSEEVKYDAKDKIKIALLKSQSSRGSHGPNVLP